MCVRPSWSQVRGVYDLPFNELCIPRSPCSFAVHAANNWVRMKCFTHWVIYATYLSICFSQRSLGLLCFLKTRTFLKDPLLKSLLVRTYVCFWPPNPANSSLWKLSCPTTVPVALGNLIQICLTLQSSVLLAQWDAVFCADLSFTQRSRVLCW